MLGRLCLDLDDRLGPLATAKDDQQIGDQGLPLVIGELLSGGIELFDGVLDDLDTSLDDRLAGVDQRQGLLSHQHGLGDLGSVGEVIEPKTEDTNASRIHRFLEFCHVGLRDLLALHLQAR